MSVVTMPVEPKLKDTAIAEFLLTEVLDVDSISKRIEKEVGTDVKDLVAHIVYEVVMELLHEGHTAITVDCSADDNSKKVILTSTYYTN